MKSIRIELKNKQPSWLKRLFSNDNKYIAVGCSPNLKKKVEAFDRTGKQFSDSGCY